MDLMKQEFEKRIIAIVGRPNVGKSALFNRLVGRRLAIVHEESGVTRDRLACEATWDGKRYELIDTGGVGLMDAATAADRIEEGTRQQVDIAIQDAAVIIFVTDIDAGITALDEEVAKLLHESGRPVYLAANKADNEGRRKDAVDFESLGFPVFPVSALHNLGIGDLMEGAVERLPEAQEEEARDALKVVIAGRPNAGKSSYINRLLRSDRVIVSEIPGTTRDSIEIPFTVGEGPQSRHYLLIDTAGMKRKGKTKTAVDTFSLMRAEKSIERADVVVLVVDGEVGPSTQDKKIAAQIIEHNKGCLFLVNKWDLVAATQRQYAKALARELPFLQFAPVVFASAKDGYNIRRSIEAIDFVASQIRMTLSTGLLNRVIKDAAQKVQPPVVGNRRLKFYYATQVGTEPIRIKIFANYPRKIPASYQSYLVRSLREAFGLEGAPVVLHFAARH